MDPDFINNLTNMLKNGNIPDDMKSKMNQFLNQNGQNSNDSTSSPPETEPNTTSSNNINPEMLQNLMKMFSNSNSSSNSTTDYNNSNSNFDINTILKMKSIMEKMR